MYCWKPLIFLFASGLLYLGSIVAAGLSARPVSSDLAVVLGNEVLASGKPSARLKARLDCAIDLYRRHLTRLILVSGGRGKSGFDEATVMAHYLGENGVPDRDILIDAKGINTMATADNSAALAQAMHFNRIIIVTQYYHIPRSLFAFRRAGLRALSAAYPSYFEPDDLFAIAREGVALPVYFIKMPRKDSVP